MNKRFAIIVTLIILILAYSLFISHKTIEINWAIISVLIIGLGIIGFYISLESQKVNTKQIALISTMATLAAIVRIPFVVIINLQPTTFIIMITGYVFGSQTGFIVGATAALVSNFYLGQGPWTPWQMFAWGVCGMLAGALGRKVKEYKKIPFIILCGMSGLFFGWIMNIWHWIGFVYPINLKTFLATYIASFPYDIIHVLGNITFSIIFGKSFYNILKRFKNKITTYTYIDE